MPKYYENKTVFNFTWDQVAEGFWKKYPNPNSSHVLSEDTYKRSVKCGKLFSKRILTKTNSSVPKWAKRFVPDRPIFIVEESIVDPVKKVFVTYTRNLGHTRIMTVIEKVVYCENKDSPGSTVAVRSAWIDSQVKGFGRAICAFGMDRFKKNCGKMTDGFNYVLASMFGGQQTLGANHLALATSTSNKLKDAAKSASELAKAGTAPLYASMHPNQS